MTTRLAILVLLIGAAAVSATAQAPATTSAPSGASSIETNVASLGSLDDATRTRAARLLRRAPQAEVVQALTNVVRTGTADEYVRYRAFILLTSFNDRSLPSLVRDVLPDRNDRLREAAYKWLESHPDPTLAPALLASLRTEQAEFVRPALVGALAALGWDAQVQRALVLEVDRGLDLFRSAVIDALGRHHATYAVAAIAPLATMDGPLQTDALLALGRIGGDTARATLDAVMPPPGEAAVVLRTARCLAGESCAEQIAALAAAARSTSAAPPVIQAAVGGLGHIAEAGNDDAMKALMDLAAVQPLRERVAVVLAATAVREPARVVTWLGTASEPSRGMALDLLKDGFESLEEDFGEEQFFAAVRAAYWGAPENSPTRTLAAAIIERLEF